jgi:hypothetical protein
MLMSSCAAATASRATGRVTGPPAERTAIERVVALLPPDVSYPLVVIDPEGVPDSQTVRQLDAFTVRENDGSMRPRIYLNRESLIVREVVNGKDFYLKVLAAVVVHEAAHLSGGSEVDARRAESRYFADLMARGLIRADEADLYMALLRQRESTHRDRDP